MLYYFEEIENYLREFIIYLSMLSLFSVDCLKS